MTRENVEQKARRYLAEARVIVTRVDGDDVRASVRGDGEWHRCGYHEYEGWWCSCPTRRDTCSHLIALRLITVRSRSTV